MLLLEARLLAGFPHGFTTRQGGVSSPPFDSLNLGGRVGDDPAHVAENWRRLEAQAGLAFARVRQVHGARAVRAIRSAEPEMEADAVLSAEPGLAACVSVADCVPVLLADPASGLVAAVHAGWRGTAARAAAAGVSALAEAGCRPGDLVAVVGPSIGPCCYEVSPDLAGWFGDELGAETVRDGPRPRLDLWRANALVLAAAGVRADRIEVLGRCTACERDLFFSHRRDAGRTGRQVAFVAPRRSSGGGTLP
ncbi:MAG TPA: peptidoglycan editing factor PgeF [Anaeromyxobacteraceae bacterium]|nr:peptidoglycan editing factor PgeF [Anaeromyxobacteraceae bacterium]